MSTESYYIKVDDNTILAKDAIRWAKKLNDKLIICATQEVCGTTSPYRHCFEIEKKDTPEIYNNMINYLGF